MCREDLIDFPCSETWLAFYYEQGLTSRHPLGPLAYPEGRIAELERRLAQLEAAATPIHSVSPTIKQPLPQAPARGIARRSTGLEPLTP